MSFRRFAQATVLTLVVGAVVASATAYAAKPAQYAPTLGISWPAAAATATSSSTSSTSFVVAGCGYDSSFGGVTIVVRSSTALAFASEMPDANGCISLSNFSTQGPGRYQVDAYQTLRNKASIVASTSFDA